MTDINEQIKDVYSAIGNTESDIESLRNMLESVNALIKEIK